MVYELQTFTLMRSAVRWKPEDAQEPASVNTDLVGPEITVSLVSAPLATAVTVV